MTKITLAFESLEEMTSQTEYKYGVEDGIIQMMLFQVNKQQIQFKNVLNIRYKAIKKNRIKKLQNYKINYDYNIKYQFHCIMYIFLGVTFLYP